MTMRAKIAGISVSLTQLEQDQEHASASMQQLRREQRERLDVVEQQQQQLREEAEKLKGNERLNDLEQKLRQLHNLIACGRFSVMVSRQ